MNIDRGAHKHGIPNTGQPPTTDRPFTPLSEEEGIVARVFKIGKPLVLIVLIAMNISDTSGTIGWVIEQLHESTSNVLVIASTSILLWSFTSLLQFYVTGMAYRAGANAYMATIGYLYVLLMGAASLATDSKVEENNIFVKHYRDVEASERGSTWLLLIYPISLLFDIGTDYAFFAASPWKPFATFFGLASVINEQFVYIWAKMSHVIEKNGK